MVYSPIGVIYIVNNVSMAVILLYLTRVSPYFSLRAEKYFTNVQTTSSDVFEVL